VPDLAGWRVERVPDLPDENPLTVLPDWCCEILSPRTARDDKRLKLVEHVGDMIRRHVNRATLGQTEGPLGKDPGENARWKAPVARPAVGAIDAGDGGRQVIESAKGAGHALGGGLGGSIVGCHRGCASDIVGFGLLAPGFHVIGVHTASRDMNERLRSPAMVHQQTGALGVLDHANLCRHRHGAGG